MIFVCIVLAGCGKPGQDNVRTGTYVEFTSKIGNKLICPEFWTTEDSGQNWTVGDGQAAINVYTVTAEGSGTLDDFRNLVVDNMGELSSLTASEWTDVKNNNWAGVYSAYEPQEGNEGDVWQFMIVTTGKYYHAIMIKTSSLVYRLNRGVYKNVAMTFTGIE